MKISARNKLHGTIIDVAKGATTAHVRIDLGAARWSPRRSPTKRSTN